jgi:hypothetical protein
MCGVEILSLVVSNRSQMIQSSFGTHIAEKFFRNSFTIDSVVERFHAFSLTKYHGKIFLILISKFFIYQNDLFTKKFYKKVLKLFQSSITI